MRLSELTTLRVGGPIHEVIEAFDEHSLIEAVRSADEAGKPLLVLGGGSNIVAGDAPFEGVVVRVMDDGSPARIGAGGDVLVAADQLAGGIGPACGGIMVEYFAGANWDRVVRFAVENDLVGIEALSGIPGTVGATPIQNVGAYGQEVSTTISRVRTWDRLTGQVRSFSAEECCFSYRDAIFKRTRMPGVQDAPTGRYVVLSVTFQHTQGELSAPVGYAELASRLGIEQGQRAPMRRVREEVLAIRAGKGMVLDPEDHDTWSAGSFFTNPILSAAQAENLPQDAPRFPMADGRVKTSAAWLISHAGFERGFCVGPHACLSTRHSLALTNRGGATCEDILTLARTVRDGVQDSFGVELVMEPVRVGAHL